MPIALVSLVDHDRQWFKSRQRVAAQEASREISFCAHAIAQQDALVVPDTLCDARFADNPLVTGAPNVRFYAAAVVHAPDGACIGTLCLLDRQPRALAPDDLQLLADLAAMIEREFALVAQTSTDELTGLSNRRGFAAVADLVLALCRRTRQPAAIVSIDLDNFKIVNDTLGHAAGDEVLRLFARMLGDNFRASDVVARLGGDEFAVLCSGTTLHRLSKLLDRLGSAFSASTLFQAHPGLSWSAGLAEFDSASPDSLEDLLRLSDARRYAAKAASRTTASNRPAPAPAADARPKPAAAA